MYESVNFIETFKNNLNYRGILLSEGTVKYNFYRIKPTNTYLLKLLPKMNKESVIVRS